jgi:hypothetical protein
MPAARPRREPLWRRYQRFRGVDVGADVDAEIAFHLAEREAELVARGVPPSAEFSEVDAVRARLQTMGEAHERRHGWAENALHVQPHVTACPPFASRADWYDGAT